MAVDNPHLQKEWEDWKREMEKSRERRWRGRMSHWADADARDGGEDDSVEKKSEDFKRKEDDVSEEEEEHEAEVKIDELKAGETSSEEERESNPEERPSEGNKREEAGNEEKWDKMVEKSKDKKEEEDLGDEVTEESIQGVDKEEEEHQQQDPYGRRHLRGQMNRSQVENLQQEIRELDEIGSEENNISDSDESNNCEDLEPGSNEKVKKLKDSEELEDQSWRNGFQWTALDRKEEDQKKMFTKSLATPKEFPEILQDESSDDEASVNEDDESDDVDDGNIYCKDDHPTNIFLTLKEFRDSSVLTDLTLKTMDGRSLHVHSLVLAAVSSLIWRNLKKKEEEDRVNDSQSTGVQQWSLCLGPEVDRVGLQAIVEFAYTGLISCVTKHNVDRIKEAARTLGAPRVLDVCESIRKHNENDEIFAAKQMKMNLEFIRQQWTDRVGCDVTLDALGGALHVHRVILAVSSDYFRGMFTLNMKESLQSCVSLPFLLASELEVLAGSSYSGTLPLSWTCIFEITSAALQLQYQPALSLCLNFLQREITPHTCLDVVSFAEAYEIPHLLEAAEDFALRQFQKVSCTSKFKDLPAKQLLKYLSSNSLFVSSELVVFNAAVSWIQAKPSRRIKLARELMKMVHFPLMTVKEFKEVQSQSMWCDHSLAGLYEAVLEDFCCSETAPQTQSRFYLPRECLVLIGGDQISEDLGRRSISGELWFGNSLRNLTGINKNMEWRKLGDMPESGRFSHEVAVLNGQVYVLGGKKYYGAGDTLNSVYRFDPLENSWESMSEMQERRSSFSVVVLDGKIYAIGGLSEPDHKDSVEYYCPTTNSWRSSWSLGLPLSGHKANVFKGQIFVSGGQNSDYLCLSSMFLYHPETGSTFLANMKKPRAHHCMEALGERLYVAGGITTSDNVTLINQLACEVYSSAENSWTSIASLSVPHVGAGSSVLEGKFYVLGGYSQEDYSDTKMVHRYDVATQGWENSGKMPGPNNDLRACLLSLPQRLRT